MNIILCGLPACGKTTLGTKLAAHLELFFIDTDRLIEEYYFNLYGQKLTCREITLQDGIQKFCLLEKNQVNLLPLVSKSVISLGGRTLCDFENKQKIKECGCLIYLKTPSEVVWERLQSRVFPSYLNTSNPQESFDQLVKERLPVYEEAADLVIETQEKTIENLLGEIADHFKTGLIKDNHGS